MILSIIKKIQEVLVAPTCHIINSDLDFLTKVSVRHYGVVFDVIKRVLGDKYTTEYGKVYYFAM